MLKQRILTALWLLPLMIAMLFYAADWLWAAFAGLIALLALWEYGRLTGLDKDGQLPYLGGTALFMLTAYAGGWQLPTFIWVLVLLFWLAVMPLWLRGKWTLQGGAAARFAGWLLMLPFWFALLQLRPDSSSAGMLLAVMVLVWLADSAAYFVGRAFGKTPLAPVISPKKSVEGAIGGLIAVCLYLLFARNTLGWQGGFFATVFAGAVLTWVSIGGDLLESWLKRAAGIKDSSNLLPGHGGVFDRVDSLIAVLSVYAAVQAICA